MFVYDLFCVIRIFFQFHRSASVLEEGEEGLSKAGSLDRNRNSFENPLATTASAGDDPEAAEYNRPSVL